MLWFYESFFPAVWILFLLYWQIKAANTKTTQRLEPAASRILRVFIFLIAILLLSTTRIPLPWLYLQLWPVGLWPFWLGAAVAIAGLCDAEKNARMPFNVTPTYQPTELLQSCQRSGLSPFPKLASG
jgi:hypothetical protein